jgi:hypothetical protein
MNLHHAAALALLGWYLIMPPKGYPKAPLTCWSHMWSFDTAKECQKMLAVFIANIDQPNVPPPQGFTREEFRQALLVS